MAVKITFIGAGSTVFAKNVLGDSFLHAGLHGCEIALYDIDATRLQESHLIIEALNKALNAGATIKSYAGVSLRKEALRSADFVVNAIQVGGYKPATEHDFAIPKKYGLRQTIGDTLGIGGIFRALRTLPVMDEIAQDMAQVAPQALLLNYTNPMSILSGYMQRYTSVKTVGLCHSVQVCVPELLTGVGLESYLDNEQDLQYKIAGINHMAWLLELNYGGKDIYPQVKELAAAKNAASRQLAPDKGPWVPAYEKALNDSSKKHPDMVRFEIMRRFGYYITESSEHNAEYTPYWIKSRLPALADEFNIPLDEYLFRCQEQITRWQNYQKDAQGEAPEAHVLSREYGSHIMNAIVTGKPYVFHGNVINHGSISNLPAEANVEVACIADKNGITPTHFGALPTQCAALNMTNVNVHLMTIEAARTLKKESVYQAAFLDPHTSAELSLDEMVSLCDELLEAHADYLPRYS